MKIFEGLYAFIWRGRSENNCNTYFIEGRKRILIDPGHNHLLRHVEASLKRINRQLHEMDVLLVTHGHPDHLEGVTGFDERTLFGMGGEEYQWLQQYAGHYFQCPVPDFFLQEGDLTIGDETFEVFVTPGHSPASICLYWPRQKALFTGDVVFNRSIGRSDLPGGNGALLKASIEKLASLDVDYLLSGHGEPVIGKEAVRKNFQIIKEAWFPYL